MSISTYAELSTAIQRWAHRADISADIDEVVLLAEAWLNSKLRLIEMETVSTTTASTSSRYLGYPSDMLEMVTINLQKTEYFQQLKYMSPEQLRRIVTTNSAEPCYYTVRGDIEFNCVPDSAYTVEMHYIQKLDLATDLTNEVLSQYPNIYLFACRAQVADLARDVEEEQRQIAKALDAITQAENRSKRKRGIRKQRMQSDVAWFNTRDFDINRGHY